MKRRVGGSRKGSWHRALLHDDVASAFVIMSVSRDLVVISEGRVQDFLHALCRQVHSFEHPRVVWGTRNHDPAADFSRASTLKPNHAQCTTPSQISSLYPSTEHPKLPQKSKQKYQGIEK